MAISFVITEKNKPFEQFVNLLGAQANDNGTEWVVKVKYSIEEIGSNS